MQKYPRVSGYEEHYHAAAMEEEFVVKDDGNYNQGGSAMHLMKKPDHLVSHINYNQHHGYGGHAEHKKHQGYGLHAEHKKHQGYGGGHNDQIKLHENNHHGYGTHNDRHKNRQESYSEHFSESWYEEENNGYPGHVGNHGNGGYGYHQNAGMRPFGHEGHFGPHWGHQNKAPRWNFKGISD